MEKRNFSVQTFHTPTASPQPQLPTVQLEEISSENHVLQSPVNQKTQTKLRLLLKLFLTPRPRIQITVTPTEEVQDDLVIDSVSPSVEAVELLTEAENLALRKLKMKRVRSYLPHPMKRKSQTGRELQQKLNGSS